MSSQMHKRTCMIVVFMVVIGIFSRKVMAYTDQSSRPEDMVYVFLEQAFPVLGEERGYSEGVTELVDAVFPWTNASSEGAESSRIIYDVPGVSSSELFSGYPQGEVVTEVMQPKITENIIGQYSKDLIQNFSNLQSLYACDTGEVAKAAEDLDGTTFMSYDFTTDMSSEDPVVLIFHTHGTEGYADCEKYGVIEVGDYLAEILSKQYGINVLHHKELYDEDGINGAYERMNEGISQVLEEYPSIKIAIDLHRDGIGGDGRLATTVNGKETAQVMLVNGLCKRLDANGIMQTTNIAQNPYLTENLAFSFHMKMASDTLYPGWMRNLYLKAYRYSTHMLPKSLLLEVGAEGNTLQEAKNAMEPFAQVLMTVLSGNG